MKKIIILLLFLGFSFGQNLINDSYIEGVWKFKTSDTIFIFKKDKSGYVRTKSGGEIKTSIFHWTLIASRQTTNVNGVPTKDGTLILDHINLDLIQSYSFSYWRKGYLNSDDDAVDFLNSSPSLKIEPWNGGDLLLLWDSTETMLTATSGLMWWERE